MLAYIPAPWIIWVIVNSITKPSPISLETGPPKVVVHLWVYRFTTLGCVALSALVLPVMPESCVEINEELEAFRSMDAVNPSGNLQPQVTMTSSINFGGRLNRGLGLCWCQDKRNLHKNSHKPSRTKKTNEKIRVFSYQTVMMLMTNQFKHVQTILLQSASAAGFGCLWVKVYCFPAPWPKTMINLGKPSKTKPKAMNYTRKRTNENQILGFPLKGSPTSGLRRGHRNGTNIRASDGKETCGFL